MTMPQFMTEHLRFDRPERPQSYIEHGAFAAKHSLWLIVAGAAGLDPCPVSMVVPLLHSRAGG
jgi:hypothetical protein